MVDDDKVEYQKVGSSNLDRVGYDPESENLWIWFKGSPPRRYVYYHVPPRVFAELMAAESKGKYHAAHIKKTYSYDQV
jgi:hypothetical protein